MILNKKTKTIFVSTANHAIPAWGKKNNTRIPPLETQAPKKKHCSWNIPWSWGATGKQSQDADDVDLGNKQKTTFRWKNCELA